MEVRRGSCSITQNGVNADSRPKSPVRRTASLAPRSRYTPRVSLPKMWKKRQPGNLLPNSTSEPAPRRSPASVWGTEDLMADKRSTDPKPTDTEPEKAHTEERARAEKIKQEEERKDAEGKGEYRGGP